MTQCNCFAHRVAALVEDAPDTLPADEVEGAIAAIALAYIPPEDLAFAFARVAAFVAAQHQEHNSGRVH